MYSFSIRLFIRFTSTTTFAKPLIRTRLRTHARYTQSSVCVRSNRKNIYRFRESSKYIEFCPNDILETILELWLATVPEFALF